MTSNGFTGASKRAARRIIIAFIMVGMALTAGGCPRPATVADSVNINRSPDIIVLAQEKKLVRLCKKIATANTLRFNHQEQPVQWKRESKYNKYGQPPNRHWNPAKYKKLVYYSPQEQRANKGGIIYWWLIVSISPIPKGKCAVWIEVKISHELMNPKTSIVRKDWRKIFIQGLKAELEK